MSESSENKFSGRAITSVFVTVAFIVLVVTGLVLFVTPPGRVANWTNWKLFGLTKSQWGALHIVFGAGFLIASIFHVYFNWKQLLAYFKSRMTRRFTFRMQWIAPTAICLAVAAATLAELPPFVTLLDWNERIKNSWEEPAAPAPVAHAELLTFEQLCAEANVDLETAKARLAEHGIPAPENDAIAGEIAKNAEMSPEAFYGIIAGQRGQGQGQGQGQGRGQGRGGESAAGGESGEHSEGGGGYGRAGGGPGRKTLSQYSAEVGVDEQTAIERLKNAGIEAAPNQTLREIAEKSGAEPYKVSDLIAGKSE
ncbi:MAG: hypothetical protein BWZ10_01449 [candidate division BRC1 bacterium ADurb.BinA364]|nr:MAG: hypothetical protein BWZ10_01449 [candidate division BRC1 bacterium ADurb.BinA364]